MLLVSLATEQKSFISQLYVDYNHQDQPVLEIKIECKHG